MHIPNRLGWEVKPVILTDKSKVYDVVNIDTDVTVHAADKKAAERIAKVLNEDSVD